MSVFAINLITGAGLGLAIDYSLFVVSRFREELATGAGPRATRCSRTMRTAGRTVLFSAVTVAAAMAALLVFQLRFLYSMGVGGVLVALTAALVSLTLLPALLAALGPRVNALSLKRWQVAITRDAEHVRAGPWYRFSQFVMRRPGADRRRRGDAADRARAAVPADRVHRRRRDRAPARPLRARGPGRARHRVPARAQPPIYVVARSDDAAAVARLRAASCARSAASTAWPSPSEAGGVWRIDVVTGAALLSDSAKGIVDDVRDDARRRSRSGSAAARRRSWTSRRRCGGSLPLALALLCSTTLVILFVMTGSVVLPVKALLMNLLTLSAAFGLLVLIFQDGRLEGLLGFTAQGALEATQPILLFCVAFGLSTDYGVFLLTRIKEARDAGAGDRESVAIGLERTGRIVTFAALLFCIAIGAFATSQVVFIKELGVGTALAVLIDAFIVRALLVPSLMALLGRWNWWAPRPLARLHARLRLGEA